MPACSRNTPRGKMLEQTRKETDASLLQRRGHDEDRSRPREEGGGRGRRGEGGTRGEGMTEDVASAQFYNKRDEQALR